MIDMPEEYFKHVYNAKFQYKYSILSLTAFTPLITEFFQLQNLYSLRQLCKLKFVVLLFSKVIHVRFS